MSNPHITAALACLDPEGDFLWGSGDLANISARLEAQAHATLALAYEARTANLLTSQQIAHAALFKGGTFSAEANAELIRSAKEIETRLGLGDTK